MASIDVLLKAAVDQKASDLHISVGLPPILRLFGELKKLPYQPLSAQQTAGLVREIEMGRELGGDRDNRVMYELRRETIEKLCVDLQEYL